MDAVWVADHDPIRFVTDLGAKLASTSRHVCTFLGAGVARACGLPDVTELQDRVLKTLQGKHRKQFARQREGQNLEQALSRLRRLAGLLPANETLYGLTAEDAVQANADGSRSVQFAPPLPLRGATCRRNPLIYKGILVEQKGFEPSTPTLRTWCSPS